MSQNKPDFDELTDKLSKVNRCRELLKEQYDRLEILDKEFLETKNKIQKLLLVKMSQYNSYELTQKLSTANENLKIIREQFDVLQSLEDDLIVKRYKIVQALKNSKSVLPKCQEKSIEF